MTPRPRLKVVSPESEDKIITGNCSICGRPMIREFRPFCSRRCSDVDLSRWLTGSYAIAGAGADADEDGESNGDLPAPATRDQQN